MHGDGMALLSSYTGLDGNGPLSMGGIWKMGCGSGSALLTATKRVSGRGSGCGMGKYGSLTTMLGGAAAGLRGIGMDGNGTKPGDGTWRTGGGISSSSG